jgi:hypothetical protein
MKTRKILITAALIACTFLLHAQTASLEGFKNIHPSFITPIFEGTEVKGYTTFYKSDKADKGNDNYSLSIFDENLTKTKTISMKKPRGKFFLLGNGYNGNLIGFYFYNTKDKQFEIEAYDKTLKKTGSRIFKEKLTNMEQMAISQRIMAEEKEQSTLGFDINLFPVPNKGFIRNGLQKGGKGFTLEMLDNDLKTLWTYETPEKLKDLETFVSFDVTDKYMIGMMLRRSGMMSTKFTYYITAFDIESGKKIIDVPVEAEGSTDQLSLNTVKYDATGNQIIAIGDYYAENDKPGSDKSKGFYFKTFSMDGKETNKKQYSWARDVKSLMPPEAKESLEKGAMNYTHKVLKGADGKFYLVCEQFNRSASAMGIAGKVMSGGRGGASVSKCNVWNLMVFVINPDFTLSEIKFYPKDKSSVEMPAGAANFGPGIAGMILKSQGGFDYQFTQMTNDNKSFDVVYIDYDKEKGESTKRILGNIIIAPDGTFTLDKMDITSKASSSFLYPSKPGHLMMVDWLKKEKTVGMKLVKLNY